MKWLSPFSFFLLSLVWHVWWPTACWQGGHECWLWSPEKKILCFDCFKFHQFNTDLPENCVWLSACKQSTTNIPLAAAGGQPTPQTHTERKWTWERKCISAALPSFFFCLWEDRSIRIRKERRPAPKKLSQGTHTHIVCTSKPVRSLASNFRTYFTCLTISA